MARLDGTHETTPQKIGSCEWEVVRVNGAKAVSLDGLKKKPSRADQEVIWIFNALRESRVVKWVKAESDSCAGGFGGQRLCPSLARPAEYAVSVKET